MSYRSPCMCGAYDCERCRPGCNDREDEPVEGTVETSKAVTARKARYTGKAAEIRPGDRVQVTNGFTYEVNGPRTGYYRTYKRVARGPAWNVDPGTIRVRVLSKRTVPCPAGADWRYHNGDVWDVVMGTFEVDCAFRENPVEVDKAARVVATAANCTVSSYPARRRDADGTYTVYATKGVGITHPTDCQGRTYTEMAALLRAAKVAAARHNVLEVATAA